MFFTTLFALLACTAATDDTGDTARPIDTDEADTDTDTSDDVAPVDHAILTLTIAGRGEGFDLDGDGAVDNAGWVLASVIDPLFETLLASAARVLVVQVADAESLVDDPAVWVALLTVDDTDGDPSDNAAAGETYTATPAVDESGRALVGVDSALVGGSYQAQLLNQTIEIGELSLETATPVLLAGDVTATQHTGLLGFGVDIVLLSTALTTAGYSDAATSLAGLADLDMDADGTDDAISFAFSFDAVACTVVK
jgi:hypothetical protein